MCSCDAAVNQFTVKSNVFVAERTKNYELNAERFIEPNTKPSGYQTYYTCQCTNVFGLRMLFCSVVPFVDFQLQCTWCNWCLSYSKWTKPLEGEKLDRIFSSLFDDLAVFLFCFKIPFFLRLFICDGYFYIFLLFFNFSFLFRH